MRRARDLATADLVRGIALADRAMLGRALTLIESTAAEDRQAAERLLGALPPDGTHALRVGITGAPGAGKSTFLEALGVSLVSRGSRIGILAVDPSSGRTGGSVLGDKTRMNRLAQESLAFIRPTPSSGALGGVAPGTREGVRVLEAAGCDAIFVETVGVGQSEIEVASLVDTLVWITGPNAGDELQAIKRGIVEMVDVAVVNKADGERLPAASRAKGEIEAALHYVSPNTPGWTPPVLTASALGEVGIAEVEGAIRAHREHLERSHHLQTRRSEQTAVGFWRALERESTGRLRKRPELVALAADLGAGRTSLHAAVDRAFALIG